MKQLHNSWLVRYGFAVSVTVLALLVCLLFSNSLVESRFVVFCGAVALAGGFGGLGPALLASVLSIAAAAFIFLASSSAGLSELELPQFLIFATVLLGISSLSEVQIRGRRQASNQGELFYTTLSSIGDAVIATNQDGQITFMNTMAEMLTGWRQHEAVDRNIGEVFHIINAETREKVENPIDRVMRENAVIGVANHVLIMSRNGNEVIIDDSGAPIRSADGNVTGAVMVFRDITIRRRAELDRDAFASEITRERQRLKDIVDSIPGVVWESWGRPDLPTERTDFVSDYVEAMLGYSKEEWLNTSNFWLKIVHPDDQKGAADRAVQGYESSERDVNEFRWQTKDDRSIWVQAQSVTIRDVEGKPVGRRGVTMDITERRTSEDRLRASEERLRRVFENMPILMAASDDNGNLVVWNRECERVTGYSAEEMIGNRQMWETVAPDPTYRAQAIAEFQSYPGDHRNFEIEITRKDGTTRVVSWSNFSQSFPVAGWSSWAVGIDVTERKDAETRQEFLAKASIILSSSLDVETTMNQLAELAVPTLGDWCTASMLDEQGWLKPVAIKHIDRAKIAWAWDLNRQRVDIVPDRTQGEYKVINTGKSEFAPVITDEMLAAVIKDPDDLRLIRELGLTSTIIVPLTARGRTMGTFTLVATESRRHFTESDLAFAEDLASRAALAISNAQLYEQIRGQREQLEVTLTSIGDAVISTDAQGRVTFMNPVAEGLTGWQQREAAMHPLDEVFRIVNEENRQIVENPVTKVIREGRIVGLANHTVLIGRNGRETPIDDSGAPIRDEAGSITAAILVFRDITERKLIQDDQVFLIQASATLAESLDHDGTLNNLAHLVVPRFGDNCVIDMLTDDALSLRRVAVASVDPVQEAQLQELRAHFPADPKRVAGHQVLITRKPMLIADHVEDFIENNTHDTEHKKAAKQLAAKSILYVPLVAHERSIGVIILAMVNSGRTYTQSDIALINELAYRAAIAVDNSQLLWQAQQAVGIRDEFLSVAAHELKTPVTSLRGFAQTIIRQLKRDGNLDPAKVGRALEAIDQQSTRLAVLLGQLLDISRIQSGNLALDLETADIVSLVAEVVNRAQINTSLHTLHLDGAKTLLAQIDPIRLEQVITNLIDNAIKYSPEGGPIEIEITRPTRRTASIAVTDRGIGIPEERREHIFDRFYQAHRESNFGGIGLGLYISRQIVEMHQGTLHVEFP